MDSRGQRDTDLSVNLFSFPSTSFSTEEFQKLFCVENRERDPHAAYTFPKIRKYIHTHKKNSVLMPHCQTLLGLKPPRGPEFHVFSSFDFEQPSYSSNCTCTVYKRLCSSFPLFTCFFPGGCHRDNHQSVSPFPIWNGSWFGKPLN